MKTKIEEVRYRIFWLIGAVLSSLLYFSGIFRIYLFIRNRILKRFRTIVLTYHRIGNNREDSDITVYIENFRRQIVYLKKNFNVISLNILIENLEKKQIR